MPVKIIPEGTRYGRLTVTGKYEIRESGKRKMAYFECKCDCGKTTWVRGNQLRYGSTKSCGCYGKEQRMKAVEKHNMSNGRLYRIWNNMRTRCNKPYSDHYSHYGARGISVCEEWDNKNDGFKNFYDWSVRNGYSENLSIDRINNDGNYEPSNCRWVTSHEQNRNKRTNHYIEVNGEKIVITDVALEHGISCGSIVNRLNKGCSIEEALTKEKPKKRLIYYKGEFLTPRQFSNITGINYNTISSRITKGYSNAEDLIIPNRNVFSKKPVKQYDLNGNFIASYSSASEAAKENNCCKSGVIECCNGKKRHFKNWVFCYDM